MTVPFFPYECKTEENGLLEISVDSYQTGKFSLEELGQIRLVEIIGGNEYWNRETVTYKNFMGINNPKEILNMQPVYDLDLKSQSGNKKYFTVSKYVLNRLITGETHGLALKALGPIVATIKFAGKETIKLYFNRIKQ